RTGIPIFSLLNGLRMRDRGCEFVMMLRGRVLAVAERPSAMSMSQRLDFASLSRKTIRKVQWKDSGQRSFSDRLITIHGRPRDDVSLMNYKFESSVTAALQLSSKELSRRLDK